tara:strand:- start:1068 stop:2801 length:1734 start_codon:yes stop_codon:yes gene_type:complete
MANQMIALQTRNPQLPDPSKMTSQYATMMNLAQQNETSRRQGLQAQQAMDIKAAEEARAVDLQKPALAEAGSKATSAMIKTAMDFNNFVRTALSVADTPDQVTELASRIARQPQFQDEMFQGSLSEAVASMPRDPAQFDAWKKQTALSTLEADKRYKVQLKTQTTGAETREIAISDFGGDAVEVPGSRYQAAQGFQYITDDQGNIRAVPKESAGSFGTPAPAVGTQPSMGAPGQGNTADVVYGFGKYGSPDKPLSTMRMGDVQNFQKELINKTRGKVGAGPNKGTGAVGTYQFTYETLQDMAPKVFGANWRDKPFTADAQEKLAKALYEERKGGNLKDTWAGLPSNRPGQYTNVPWEQVRDKIIRVESGGGPRRTPTSGASAPTGTTGEPPIVVKGSGAKAKPSTEGERRFGTISRQMRTNLKGAVEILQTNPNAIRPSGTEYAASQIPFYGEEARLFAESEPRQQFVATILRFLDNITFVNTGAGTSKEQEANYRRSYIPTYQDTPASAYRKMVAMADFAKNVKDAAGVMWTPELDADFNALTKAIEKLKPKGAAAPKAGPRTSTTPKSLQNIFGG